ncbi:TlpA disulfide reductase family protein [Sphingobacterium bambusae]|uniref:Redoxin domain-containing protein n=1 Tax=Sphingobacterium bambusae TaxID=662858 RepID=A0ABW6BBA2_9SPHI|nr:TlpA disulfide reductase family protein [Sphingobacterium bambusae]WPL49138.1 TlpA disulfide reductase family protein [Sphingobacterium bambusae]
MKKKNLLLISTSLFAAISSYAQHKANLQLTGTVKGADAKKIYLQQYDNKIFKIIDSATIERGKFNFKTLVELPELYGLSIARDGNPYPVFLEQGHVQVSVSEDGSAYSVQGSKAQAYFEKLRENSRGLSAEEFIAKDPSSIVSAYALFRNYSYSLSPEEITRHIALLSPALQQTQYVRILRDLVEKQTAVAPGKKAIDFFSKDQDGKEVRFFDHLGKGYVLLDFWAAWCPPCRKENPNIVAAYKQYKDQGFSVFGVSLDKEKSAWLKAINDDGLHWTQVSDLAFWDTQAAALYGVRFIPSNLLVAPDGTIVAKNIKGEDLQRKLAEIYGQGEKP